MRQCGKTIGGSCACLTAGLYVVCCVAAGAQAHGAAIAIPFDFGGKPIPVWSGGALVALDRPNSDNPVVRVFDREGAALGSHSLSVPGARVIHVVTGCFARGFDGTVAVCGSAVTEDPRSANFLAIFSPAREIQTTVRLSPMSPFGVTVGPDGIVWLVGRENSAVSKRIAVWRFDREGKFLGPVALPGSASPLPGIDSNIRYTLAASRSRIGLYADPLGQYVEFSPDGAVLNTYPAASFDVRKQDRRGLGLCDDGAAFIGVVPRGEKPDISNSSVLFLDRKTDGWRAASSGIYWVYGCDGAAVAAWPFARRPHEIEWIPVQ